MKIQLKRSAVATDGVAKQPDIGQMEFGELAVNYNSGDPAIFLKDNAQNIIRIAGAGNINAGDNPSGPQLPDTGNTVGDVFFNTSNNKLYFWDGTAWVPIATDVTAADIFVGTLDEINLEVPEATRRNGFLWWNVEDGSLYIWYIDADTSQFVIAIPASGSGGASVAVLDTPPTGPNDGDLWWNTVDGRLYIWYQETVDNGQWVDSSPDSQTSPITSGETFPAEALENDCFFNTTDGRLYIYYNDGDEKQWVDASPDSQGAVYWNRIDGTLIPTSNTNDVSIGDGNITLNADGSAEFSGDVQVGLGDVDGATAAGVRNYSAGISRYVKANTVGSFADYYTKDTGTPKISLLADGSAEFAGDVEVGANWNVSADLYTNNDTSKYGALVDMNGTFLASRVNDSCLILNQKGNSPAAYMVRMLGKGVDVIAFGNDGSAIFAGLMTVNEAVRSDRTSGNNACFSARLNGTEKASIKADGSATFAGDIQIGDYNTNAANNAEGAYIYKVGSYQCNRANGASSAFIGRLNGTVTSQILGDGAATFKSVNGQSVFIQLESDNPSKYYPVTDDNGEVTRVYNGATLDVKDSLQKILAALVAIKTASETAGTLDDLKTAIATATSNITEGGN